MRDIEQQLREVTDPDQGESDASTEANLTRLRRMREALDDLTAQEVHAARSYGRSWAQIGACLGVTKQAAHERYRTPRADAPHELATGHAPGTDDVRQGLDPIRTTAPRTT